MPIAYPRCYVVIEGAKVPCISASVSRSAQRTSDTFAALLSITKAAEFGFDLKYWTEFEPTDVTVLMSSSFGGGDERDMITGKVDAANIALGSMRVSLTGRDKSASLHQKKRNEKFNNQKPKDIASKIAKYHGLSLSFKGDADFAGKIYDTDTVALALNRTDFSIISRLAEQIGYRWYVNGTMLFMEPKDEGSDSFDVLYVPPVPGQPADANVLELTLRRDLEKARPINFTVKSWHHRSKRLFKHTAKIDGQGDPLAYEDHHPGKNQKQVEDLAKSRARDVIRHELAVSVRAPGDLIVDVRQTLNLMGTGTVYDQAYAIDHVTWDMEEGSEFTMVVDAKAAKQGRDPMGSEGSSKSSDGSSSAPGSSSAAATPSAASSPPLPPARPPGIGPIDV